jgi:hypothetical protein
MKNLIRLWVFVVCATLISAGLVLDYLDTAPRFLYRVGLPTEEVRLQQQEISLIKSIRWQNLKRECARQQQNLKLL